MRKAAAPSPSKKPLSAPWRPRSKRPWAAASSTNSPSSSKASRRFHEGLAQYASGLSALAENYGQLESGANQLANGTGQLAGGAGELSSGMNQLNASTITLPETMKRQIADMTAEFDFPKFDPVSFVSPQNANVEAVQFVMTTAAIEQPETPEPEEPEQEQTIWDRFLALFQG